MALTSGNKLGPYEIQSPLGAGGMGEVYRATDTKLGRDVALKVLPAEMAHDPERLARFRREAKALAQLDHPNIVTIHSVEESDGVHFLTMQLVEGQPLDRLIPQDGLPIEQIVEIASALADALAAAHEKGIVHRDLKPANVMVTNDGRVKVLDFGLAKDVRTANLGDATLTSASQTQVGVVMGTPAYMSPEQTSGRPLDHRTDIFSLGVVLHEMATGRRPFDGSSSAELVSAILRDTPPSVTDVRPDLPSDLARIIRRCLEKDPRHRLQTARDVSNEFRDLTRQTSQKIAATTPSASRAVAAAGSGAARAEEGFWVAVLPFKHKGPDPGLEALAEGITEEIITGLSRFSYLRVIARGSTAKYSSESRDVRAIGKELGARYVMEGSIRQAGSTARVAVQLVDAITGAHLWAETFERAFRPDEIFALQDQLVPRIVSTVADTHGVLPYSMNQTLRNKNPDELSPYEALLRGFAYFKHVNEQEHAGVRTALERAVQQAPGNADCWAMLSMLYREENNHGFNLRPDPVGRALAAARRAVDAAPSNHLAHHALASVLFFRRETQAFRSAAQRAIELNPMDGFTIGYMGFLISYSGDWERGCGLMEQARNLNPNHPGWYWFPPFFNAYRKGDYRAALEFALKVNMPGFWRNELALAATYGQLGELELARNAARELLAVRPGFEAVARKECAKWWEPELVERIIDGLRKAGLEIASEKAVPSRPEGSVSPAKADSGAARADEGFWVAVLPFKHSGGNADLKALADGLSQEIVTGLSRFSYLRVIAQGSTAKYSSESADIRAIGKELGARYVMEGSLRQAGTKLRLAVQLVDAVSGAHLWAENYERTFSPEAVFELQDDLVPRIVSTVADMNGVLPRSMSEAVRSRNPEQLSPYEAVLRSFGYLERVTPEDLATARSGLELVVRKAPAYADAWAMLAILCVQDYAQGFNLQADSLTSALTAARRAVEAAPSNPLAYSSLAQALFFQKEFQSFRNAAERAVALNPMDGNSIASLGAMLAYAGDWERGLALAGRAKQLNPSHPGWYWFADFCNSYRQGDYRGALSFAIKINMPRHWSTHVMTAAACGQLGERDAAGKALRDLLQLRPDFAATARKDFAKWWDPEYGERIIDGLRKAGLEIADNAGTSSASALTASASGAVRAEEGFWVAVLPFKYSGCNAELTSLAEGLTEGVVTGLSRFSYLRVIARSSTAHYANQSVDVRTAGKELGARYVMEGSLRQAGTKLRLAVQLVDTVSGAHLWAENYERSFNPEAVFELQDELVPRIVSTVADGYGVLPYSMSDLVRSKALDQLSPYEALLRSIGYGYRATPEEHAAARTCMERAVQQAPGYADGWAILSVLYADEYGFGFNAQPDPLGRALQAARRAADAAPSNSFAQTALAKTLFFRKEFQAFRTAAEQAISLNPMDGAKLANVGSLLAYSGDWEHGCALVERAMQLNPRHPGWYWFPLFYNAYRKGDYRGALSIALKINMPGFFATHEALAAAYGQLGERDAASQSLGEMLKLVPSFAKIGRALKAKWFAPEMVEHVIDGLRKAGLEIPHEQSSPVAKPAAETAGNAASTTPSIAVLPFANMSADKDQEYFSDGLAEEIINLLAHIPGLKVIARTSAFAFRGKEQDIRRIADALGVTHVLQGSVRRAGERIRVTAQLIHAGDGAHLWSERYDRDLTDVFAIQDEIGQAISEALKVRLAPRAQAVNIEAYENYLRGRHHVIRLTPEGLEKGKECYEKALVSDPNYATVYSALAEYYHCLWILGIKPMSEVAPLEKSAAEKALAIDPTNSEAHSLLAAMASSFDYDWKKAEAHHHKAMEGEPVSPWARFRYAVWYLLPLERVEDALEQSRLALETDPLNVVFHWGMVVCMSYAKRYRDAIECARRGLEIDPNSYVVWSMLGEAQLYAGLTQEAVTSLQRVVELAPWWPMGVGLLAAACYQSGDHKSGQEWARKLSDLRGRAYGAAMFHAAAEEVDAMFEALEETYRQRDVFLVHIQAQPLFGAYRADPRFQALLRKMNLA